MFFSFLRARINVLTKGLFEPKLFFFMNRVEFDSICLKNDFFLLSGNHVLRIVNVFVPIGIMQISLSYHPSLELSSVFSVALLLIAWHLAYRASGNIGLATAIIF